MKFDNAVKEIKNVNDLKRVASAYVVDYRNLDPEETRKALIKAKTQYYHKDPVNDAIEYAFYKNDDNNMRLLSQIIIREILLNEDGHILSSNETNNKVGVFEQKIVNRSNEIEISQLSYRSNDSRCKDIELYFYVLDVAWKHENTKTVGEVHLLRKLRDRLHINERDHFIMEAKLGKFPKANNEPHSRGEIQEARRFLHSLGLLFPVRDQKDSDMDVIPEEVADTIKEILNKEIKEPNYYNLIRNKYIYKKNYLCSILEKTNVVFNPNEKLDSLVELVVHNIPPSILIGGVSHRDGISNEDLYKWCSELGLPVSGTKQERIERIIIHYDSLRQTETKVEDERAKWFEMIEALARRDYSLLRSHNIITKDKEVESKFEDATSYLFQTKLNNKPIKQVGTNHPDGLLILKDMYVMWDNKGKETPVDLKDHIKQFHDYMENADKAVPIFIVVAADYTDESESVAIKYTSENIGRNILLITAKELKELAEKWSIKDNKHRDEPFPLGLLARTGRYHANLINNIS